MTGAELRACRKKLNFTQQQFAEYLGVALNTISRWEREALIPENQKMLEWAVKGMLFELAGESKRERKLRLEVQAMLAEMSVPDQTTPKKRPRSERINSSDLEPK